MSLTQEQIEKISLILSRIRLGSQKMGDSINSVLNYINILNEVDTTGVIPTNSVVGKESILRDDLEIRTIDPSELLACSGQKIIGNQIAITNIMK